VNLHRRSARLLAVIALIGVPLLTATPAHADEQLPFKDPNAVGLIGFCDANNKPVTSGHVRDVPFAVKAVSNTPAGKAYAVTGRKAELFATSPNKELDPSLWSPYQMTPSTFYSNPAHPMAAAGYGEPPLEYHVTGSPPTLDNLVQFRMYLSAPNTTPYIQKYPTAVIRVEGDRWVMVAGDRAPDCAAGTAKNINQVLGKGEPTAPPTWAANAASATKPGGSSGSPNASPTGTGAGSAGPSSSDGANGGDSAVSASSNSSSSPNVLPIALGLLLGTAAIAVIVIAFATRRTPAATTRSNGSHSNGG
jgi:hypothetical protein